VLAALAALDWNHHDPCWWPRDAHRQGGRPRDAHRLLAGTAATPTYDGFCTHCFANLFPNDPRTPLIQRASKENKRLRAAEPRCDSLRRCDSLHPPPLRRAAAAAAPRRCAAPLLPLLPLLPLISPMPISPLPRRIDLYGVVGGVRLAFEIDEHQHRRYSPDDEEARHHDLTMDATIPTLFINPDVSYVGASAARPTAASRPSRSSSAASCCRRRPWSRRGAAAR